MAIDVLPYVLDFFARYGLIAMFVLLLIDGAMINPLIPGEAVMIMAVSQLAETLQDVAVLVGIASAAAVLGAVMLYAVSRVGGRPLVDKHPRLFMMDRRKREKMEELFESRGGESVVCFLRVIPLTRVVVSIPAGIARMPFLRFVVLTMIGMVLWHAGFMWFAWQFTKGDSAVAEQATALQEAYASPAWQYLQANEALAVLAALLIGAWLSFKSTRRIRRHPLGTLHSLLGILTARVLVLGSLLLGALLYLDPTLAYDLFLAGGLDVPNIAAQIGMAPERLLLYFGAASWTLGALLWGYEASARRRQTQAEARAELEDQWEEDDEAPEDLAFEDAG